jgi:chromosome segregation ATPase
MTTPTFQTPPRILIPKLLRSRDAWKAKATQRQAQRKALQIRVRDLTVSREGCRQRVELLQQAVHDLQQQLDHARQQAAALQARLDAASPKKPAHATDPAAATTTRP